MKAMRERKREREKIPVEEAVVPLHPAANILALIIMRTEQGEKSVTVL